MPQIQKKITTTTVTSNSDQSSELAALNVRKGNLEGKQAGWEIALSIALLVTAIAAFLVFVFDWRVRKSSKAIQEVQDEIIRAKDAGRQVDEKPLTEKLKGFHGQRFLVAIYADIPEARNLAESISRALASAQWVSIEPTPRIDPSAAIGVVILVDNNPGLKAIEAGRALASELHTQHIAVKFEEMLWANPAPLNIRIGAKP